MIIRILRLYFKLILRIYYKEIKVEGLEHLNQDKPLLLVSNHPNALIDALVLITELDSNLVLTATSSLGNYPFMKSLMRKANIQLFYRRMDGHSEEILNKNKDTMDSCANILVEGEKLLMFPEGKSSPNGKLMRFKTGFSRIAQRYVEKTGEDLDVVPIYLGYSSREKIRSKVFVKFHEPFKVKEKIDTYGENYVKEFTDEVKNTLKATEELRYNKDQPQRQPDSLHALDVIMALPFILFHLIPSAIVYLIAHSVTDRPDTYATVRVFVSIVIFPIFYFLLFIFLIPSLPLLYAFFLLSYVVIYIYRIFTNYVFSKEENIFQTN